MTTVSPFAIARVANARYLRGESAHGSYRTGRFSSGDADAWAAAADGDGGGHHCGGGVTGIAARHKKKNGYPYCLLQTPEREFPEPLPETRNVCENDYARRTFCGIVGNDFVCYTATNYTERGKTILTAKKKRSCDCESFSPFQTCHSRPEERARARSCPIPTRAPCQSAHSRDPPKAQPHA